MSARALCHFSKKASNLVKSNVIATRSFGTYTWIFVDTLQVLQLIGCVVRMPDIPWSLQARWNEVLLFSLANVPFHLLSFQSSFSPHLFIAITNLEWNINSINSISTTRVHYKIRWSNFFSQRIPWTKLCFQLDPQRWRRNTHPKVRFPHHQTLRTQNRRS